jgi:hypothetical protein
MTMKKLLLSTICVAVMCASCDDYLDINRNPNQASGDDVGSDLVLPQTELALAMAYTAIMYNHAGFIVQYFDQGVGASNFRPYSVYDIEAGDGSRIYSTIYSQCLVNAEFVRTAATEEGAMGNYFAATVVKAFALQAMVDLFGEAPYTEASKGAEIPQPKYDEGKDIYDGILAELDDAYDKLGNDLVSNQNLLFGANSTAKWVQFANALKLRILMRQASINWDGVKSKVNALIAEDNFPTQDVAFRWWVNDVAKSNPWYRDVAVFFGKTDHMAPLAYVNTLTANSDPRLDARYDKPADGGDHKGGVPGHQTYAVESLPKTKFSTPKFVVDAPSYLITVAEVEFFKAEAAIRNGASGQAAYEAAIRASFEQAGASGADALIAGVYAYNGTIDQIAVQKWISLGLVNNFESWCEVRRLGKPEFCTASANQILSDETQYESGKLVYP